MSLYSDMLGAAQQGLVNNANQRWVEADAAEEEQRRKRAELQAASEKSNKDAASFRQQERAAADPLAEQAAMIVTRANENKPREMGNMEKLRSAINFAEGQEEATAGYAVKRGNEGTGGEDLIASGNKKMLENSDVLGYSHEMADVSGQGAWAHVKEWGKAAIDPNYWLVNQALSIPAQVEIGKYQLGAGAAATGLRVGAGLAVAGSLGPQAAATLPLAAGLATAANTVQVAGASAASHVEATMESNSVYQEMFDAAKAQGKTDAEAHALAEGPAVETYWVNMAILLPTNAVEQLAMFPAVGKFFTAAAKAGDAGKEALKVAKAADRAKRVAAMSTVQRGGLKAGESALRGLATGASEGVQEGLQYIGSQNAMDKDWDFGKEFQENAMGGFFMGAGMQVAAGGIKTGVTLAGKGASKLGSQAKADEPAPSIPDLGHVSPELNARIQDKFVASLAPEVQTTIKNDIEVLIDGGMDPEAASQKALGNLMTDPAHQTTAMQVAQNELVVHLASSLQDPAVRAEVIATLPEKQAAELQEVIAGLDNGSLSTPEEIEMATLFMVEDPYVARAALDVVTRQQAAATTPDPNEAPAPAEPLSKGAARYTAPAKGGTGESIPNGSTSTPAEPKGPAMYAPQAEEAAPVEAAPAAMPEVAPVAEPLAAEVPSAPQVESAPSPQALGRPLTLEERQQRVGQEVVLTDSSKHTTKEKRLARFAAKLGIEIQFFDSETGKDIESVETAEFVNPDEAGVVYVRRGGASVNRTEAWALGHGFIHTLKLNHPELYAQLVEVIQETLTPAQKAKYVRELGASDNATNIMKNQDLLMEEILADEGGNYILSEGLWRAIKNADTTLFEKLAEIMRGLIESLKSDGPRVENHLDKLQAKRLQAEFEKVYTKVAEENANKHLKTVTARYNTMIAQEIAVLKEQNGGSVSYMPNGEDALVQRASQNAKWYRDFYAKNKRGPRKGEWRDLAIKALIRGNEETGEPASQEFLAILSDLSRGKKNSREWLALQESIRAMGDDPALAGLVADMKAEQEKAGAAPRDLSRLQQIEAKSRKGAKDQGDMEQYKDVAFSKRKEYNGKTVQKKGAAANGPADKKQGGPAGLDSRGREEIWDTQGVNDGKDMRQRSAANRSVEGSRGPRERDQGGPGKLTARLSEKVARILADKSIDATTIKSIGDPGAFFNAFKKAKENLARSAYVDLHTLKEYREMQTFLTPGGHSGVAVEKNGNIVSLFNDREKSGIKNGAVQLMLRALDAGGDRCDNYHGGLSRIYEQLGFVPVSRVKFDKEYAPDGWDFARDGEPDIVFFAHNGDSPVTVAEKYGDYPINDYSKVPLADDYDAAGALRDLTLEESNIKFSRRTGEAPKKTLTAYKLLRQDKKTGELYPLFVEAGKSTPVGVWLDADVGASAAPTKTGKPRVKSKGGSSLSLRPGWHLGDVPAATHIGQKGPSGKIEYMHDDQVWVECEVAADKNYQKDIGPNGMQTIPRDGFYRFKTNSDMTGEWIISGAIKLNRILSDSEAAAIAKKAGHSSLPRKQAMMSQRITKEIRTVLGELSIETGENLVYAPEIMEKEEYQAANILVKTFTTRDIIPYKGGSYQGFSYGEDIFLKKGMKAPVVFVAAHEAVHMLGTTDPRALRQLKNLADEYALRFPEVMAEVEKYYIGKQGYEKDEVREEFTADAVAEVMGLPGFWDMVREKSPTLIKKVVDIIDQIITKFKAALPAEDSMLKYIDDIEGFKAKVAGIIAEDMAGTQRSSADLKEADAFAAKIKRSQRKNVPIENGQRVRGNAATVLLGKYDPNYKDKIFGEVTPGGKAVYDKMVLAEVELEARKEVEQNLDKALRFATSKELKVSEVPKAVAIGKIIADYYLEQARALEAIGQYEDANDMRESAAAVTFEIMETLTQAGQGAAAGLLWAVQDATNILTAAGKKAQDAYNQLPDKVRKPFEAMVEAGHEAAQEINAGAIDGLLDDAKVDTVIKEAAEKTKKAQGEKKEKAEKKKKEIIEKTPPEILAAMVRRYVADPKVTEDDPIKQMLRTLMEVAKQQMPKEKIEKEVISPIDIMREALRNVTEYKQVWDESKEIFREQYGENFDQIEEFFGHFLSQPFADKKIDAGIKQGLKEFDVAIKDLIRNHYMVTNVIGQTLTTRLIGELGLEPNLAMQLDRTIQAHLYQMTSDAKEKALDKLVTKAVAKRDRKNFIQKMIEYSNMGAFGPEEYRMAMAKQLGLPVIDAEAGAYISRLADDIQTAHGDVRDEAIAQLNAFMSGLQRASRGQKISSIQTMAMLLNPKTNVRNILGNEAMYRADRANKYLATPIDIIHSKLTGTDRTVTFRTGGQDGYWAGFMKGARYGWRGWIIADITSQWDLGSGLSFEWRSDPSKDFVDFIGKWFGNLNNAGERTLRATLQGFDYAAYNRAYNQTLGELACLQCINNKEELTQANIDKYMESADLAAVQVAKDYGKYITFQDDNPISKGLSGFKRGANKLSGHLPGMDEKWGLGDWLMKFPRTSGALMMRGIEYSPLGFIAATYKVSQAFGAEPTAENSRAMALSLSRAMTGTLGLTAFGVKMAALGIIFGAGEDDKDFQSFTKSQGLRSNGMNLTGLRRWIFSGLDAEKAAPQEGDFFMTYDWAQPLAMSIAMGVGYTAAAGQVEASKGGIWNRVYATGQAILVGTASSVNSVVEQPLFRGIQNLVSPSYGGDTSNHLLKAFGSVLSGVPASFIPSMFNLVRQQVDNTRRYTRGTGGSNFVEETLNAMKNKIPWVSQSLPATVDGFGYNEQLQPKGMKNWFNVFLNPAYVNRYHPTPEAKLALEMYKGVGSASAFPNAVPTSYTVNGVKFQLSGADRMDLQRQLGQLTRQGYLSLDPSWSNDKKVAEMVKYMSEVGTAVKTNYLSVKRTQEYGDSIVKKWQADQKKKQ